MCYNVAKNVKAYEKALVEINWLMLTFEQLPQWTGSQIKRYGQYQNYVIQQLSRPKVLSLKPNVQNKALESVGNIVRLGIQQKLVLSQEMKAHNLLILGSLSLV